MEDKLADAAFHPHDGLVLPRPAQERCVIDALVLANPLQSV
jgi:hypothetical protein